MPITISKLFAREVLDSRGNPTVEVDCVLSDGAFGRASVPSGASTGKKEALELRDGDQHRYHGKGVLKACRNVNTTIAAALKGMAVDQERIDRAMIQLDGTPNKSNLGANAILGVSMAVLRASAQASKRELYEHIRLLYRPKEKGEYCFPVPMMNILNGGAHADHSTDFQEFMIMPVGAPTFREAVRAGSEIFHSLKTLLKSKKYNTNVGDEGGFAPTLKSNKEAPEIIIEAIQSAGYKPGQDVFLAIDVASSQFYETHKDKGYYNLKRDRKKLTSKEMIHYLGEWVKKYPFLSIEDGLSEDDWDNWKMLNEQLGSKVQLVGDDLLVTNTSIIRRAIDEKLANAVLVKVNQIGTITETVEAVNMAHASGWRSIISNRSGETEDAIIADLALGLGTGQIKTGSLSRTERLVKYNRLMRIEECIEKKALYAGLDGRWKK